MGRVHQLGFRRARNGSLPRRPRPSRTRRTDRGPPHPAQGRCHSRDEDLANRRQAGDEGGCRQAGAGQTAFTADIEMRGMLHAKVLHQPACACPHQAHRRQHSPRPARRGRRADLAGYPARRLFHRRDNPIRSPVRWIPSRWINKVRFVGDRVAFVAAETAEIAEAGAGADRGGVRDPARRSSTRASR